MTPQRVNVCPYQGSRTIRTEDAVLIALSRLSPFIANNAIAKGEPGAESEDEEEVEEFSDEDISEESSDDDGNGDDDAKDDGDGSSSEDSSD